MPAVRSSTALEGFAVAAPGFEDLVAGELRAAGLGDVGQEPGGAAFRGSWEDVYRANLWSRVASRVLVRVAHFEATSFQQLEQGLRQIDWPAWLAAAPTDLRIAKSRTRLYHTGKVAEVLRGTVDRALGPPPGEPAGGAGRLYLRIAASTVTVSLDTSGEHLHLRGYRLATGPAPMRENLAAGLLLRTGWDGREPLLDPFCGSGTFPVEGALLALRIPPGRRRPFAFEKLPSFDGAVWDRVKGEAEAAVRDRLPQPVFASDRSAEALRLTVRAAREAGVADLLQVAQADVREVRPAVDRGLVVANPPYGRRLAGEGAALTALAQSLRGGLAGWRWAVVLGRRSQWDAMGIPTVSGFRFSSGGIRLGLYQGPPFTGERERVS